MALHNSFKQGQTPQGTRLAAAPTTEDLTLALAQAGKSGKRPVVMSWRCGPGPLTFWLSVTAGGGNNQVEWLLQKGEENSQPKDIWTKKTADTKLIQNLCASEDEAGRKAAEKKAAQPEVEAAEQSNSASGIQKVSDSHLQSLNQQQAEAVAGSAAGSASGSAAGTVAGAAVDPAGPIVLGGSSSRSGGNAAVNPASPWQAAGAPAWTTPQHPDMETSGGWGMTAAAGQPGPDGQQMSSGERAANPFAALKGTVEEKRPSNPFNALMSNQSLPQLPKPEPSIPTKKLEENVASNGGLPQMPTAQAVQPAQPAQPTAAAAAQSGQNTQSQKQSSSQNPFIQQQEAFRAEAQQQQQQQQQSSNKNQAFNQMSQSAAVQRLSSPHHQAIQPHSSNHLHNTAHPPVPNFAAMTSSGTFSPVTVPQDQALGPKQNAAKPGAPSVVQTVSAQAKQSSGGKPAKQLPAPVELDRAAVDGVFKTLSNPETGLLTHASFLFFVVREFSRFQVNGEPFSLITMEMNVLLSSNDQKAERPLPPRAVRAAIQKIFSLTRQLDLLAHYEQNDYAMLLPGTSRQQAQDLAQAISKSLLSQPLLPDMEPNSFVLHMGVASFPDDTSHPGILLAAARDARTAARLSAKPMMLFSEA